MTLAEGKSRCLHTAVAYVTGHPRVPSGNCNVREEGMGGWERGGIEARERREGSVMEVGRR